MTTNLPPDPKGLTDLTELTPTGPRLTGAGLVHIVERHKRAIASLDERAGAQEAVFLALVKSVARMQGEIDLLRKRLEHGREGQL